VVAVSGVLQLDTITAGGIYVAVTLSMFVRPALRRMEVPVNR
jgi:predicted exporter